jgi:hypothetical protein
LICFGSLVADPVFVFISVITALNILFATQYFCVCAFSSYCAFCDTFICMLYITVLLNERQVSHFYICKRSLFCIQSNNHNTVISILNHLY